MRGLFSASKNCAELYIHKLHNKLMIGYIKLFSIAYITKAKKKRVINENSVRPKPIEKQQAKM